ncbi:NUDIX domain-containing protein [Streptomyces halstedii]|uniref:NUDIX domain-containing protein n=1 Tax=Streptomyces halstedii TaxID=1944 RepID=UPI00296F7762
MRYTADVVLLAADHVLLIERGWDPYKNSWALPGGHVDSGETSLARRHPHGRRGPADVTARPRPSCPRCHGEGGWWIGGAFPEMEACGCWSDRREIPIRLLPVPGWDEPPF